MQQASFVVASSFHHQAQSNTSADMSCHHMMSELMIKGTDCPSPTVSDNESCCKVDCHCSASGCSASALITIVSMQRAQAISSMPSSFYVFEAASMHSVSLFRPPIFS